VLRLSVSPISSLDCSIVRRTQEVNRPASGQLKFTSHCSHFHTTQRVPICHRSQPFTAVGGAGAVVLMYGLVSAFLACPVLDA
jgi:hypothetical protein